MLTTASQANNDIKFPARPRSFASSDGDVYNKVSKLRSSAQRVGWIGYIYGTNIFGLADPKATRLVSGEGRCGQANGRFVQEHQGSGLEQFV